MDGMAELDRAIDAVAVGSAEPGRLADDELGTALVDLHRFRARLGMIEARLTAAFDQRKAYRSDGSRSAAAWLARRCNTWGRATHDQTRRARRLRHMPITATAFGDGEVDQHHVDRLAMLAGSARRAVAVAFPEAEKTLVELARTLPFEDFVQALRRWEELVDEEAAEDRAQRDHQARRVHLSQTFRGNFVLDGQLEVLGGTELATSPDEVHEGVRAPGGGRRRGRRDRRPGPARPRGRWS